MKRNIFNCLWMLWIMAANAMGLSGQTTDSLNRYLGIAARNNAAVKADFLAYKASLQKIPQAGAYQDPQLEMGFFLEPMELTDGRQIGEFKLMQMFPWFGTRKAAQTEAVHMAKMAFEKFRETRDALYLEVYTQWYILCRLQQQLMNHHENKKLLAQLEELAVRRFAAPGSTPGQNEPSPASVPIPQGQALSSSGGGMSGMASMGGGNTQAISSAPMAASGAGSMSSGMNNPSPGLSEVLRIRLEVVEIENNIENLLSEIGAEKAKFNALLNLPAGSDVFVPESFGQIPILFDTISVKEKMENRNPMLSMIQEEGLAYKAKGEMDKKMSYPMFGVGLQYMLVGKSKSNAADMGMSADKTMSRMNGKDMLMPMLSVSIPIFRNKYRAQQRESRFMQQSSKERYTSTLNTLEAEWHKNRSELDNAARKIALYEKQEELARTTYRLIVKEFITGKSDLSNVIQVQRQLLDYQLKKAEAMANYNTKVASLQKIISFQDSEQ